MHCISDSDRYWTLLPPANDLQAQLILRGELPEVVTEGVTLSYAVEPGFEPQAEHVRFWEYEDKLFGTELPENVGQLRERCVRHVSGKGVAGELMAGLTPRQVNSVEEIKGRTPWMQEPDCLTCHEDFYPPESRDVRSFNVWTENAEELYRMRSGEAGIQCQACHGATHAVYPARNIWNCSFPLESVDMWSSITWIWPVPLSSFWRCGIRRRSDMVEDFSVLFFTTGSGSGRECRGIPPCLIAVTQIRQGEWSHRCF